MLLSEGLYFEELKSFKHLISLRKMLIAGSNEFDPPLSERPVSIDDKLEDKLLYWYGLVDSDDNVIACVSLDLNNLDVRPEPEVCTIYVHPEYRYGKGKIIKEMMIQFYARMLSEGIEKLCLDSWEGSKVCTAMDKVPGADKHIEGNSPARNGGNNIWYFFRSTDVLSQLLKREG